MYSHLLAAAMLLGQIAGGAGPQSNAPMKARHGITYDGVSFTVDGWKLPGDNGLITWFPEEPGNARAWAEAKARAKATAAGQARPAGARINYGLDPGRTFADPKHERYHATSEAGHRFVAQAKAGDSLPDDSDKPFLSVIGEPYTASAVAADLKDGRPLAGIRDLVRFQAFKPTDWQVRGIGLPTNGSPTIILQAPDGKVLYRQESYEGGGAKLMERIAGKVRKPNPDYDPTKDPGPDDAVTGEFVPWAIIAGSFLVLLLPNRGVNSS